jgi:streptopain
MNRIKYLLSFLVLVVLILSCQKEVVNEPSTTIISELEVSYETALIVAKNFAFDNSFFNERNEKTINEVVFRSPNQETNIEVKEIAMKRCEDNEPAFYVINLDPEGWVIVSANKLAPPILAHSKSGLFNLNENSDLPPGLVIWMNDTKRHIQTLRNNPEAVVDENNQKSWDGSAPPDGDDEIIISGGTVYEQSGPLLLTKWGQGQGFNEGTTLLNCYGEDTPNNGYCWAGCVATAAAQVMKKWEHPTYYNWEDMPTNSSGSYATASLMRDIGDKVGMRYSCTSSSAKTSKLENALKNDFNYSNNIDYVSANSSQLTLQLGYGNPVIMRGDDGGNSGHAWVCDGYKRTLIITIHNPGTMFEYETSVISGLEYHMNWGWKGAYDTWYYYFDLTPDAPYDPNYNNDKMMLINVHP